MVNVNDFVKPIERGAAKRHDAKKYIAIRHRNPRTGISKDRIRRSGLVFNIDVWKGYNLGEPNMPDVKGMALGRIRRRCV